ncbi:MAG: hypothetical protein AAFV51_03005 [Pseudomonadota bacterium]
MRALALLIAIALAGCGFRPMYAEGTGAVAGLNSLALGRTTGLEDAVRAFNDSAIGLFPADPASARYRVNVQLQSRRRAVSVQTDDSVTRNDYVVTADWRIVAPETGEVVYRGTSQATASFSILDAQYAAYVSELDALKRAAGVVATDINRRSAAFFATNGPR